MVEIWKTIEKPLTPIVHMKKKNHWKAIDTNGSHVKKNIEKPSTTMVPLHLGKNLTIAQVYNYNGEIGPTFDLDNTFDWGVLLN